MSGKQMPKLVCVVVLSGLLFSNGEHAQPAPSLSEQIAEWNALPEVSEMRGVCQQYLVYAQVIEKLMSEHADSSRIIRWENQEISREIKENPTVDPMDIQSGGQTMMNQLISHYGFDGPIYHQIPGGFPQWSYRSCLKGRELR